MRSEIEKYLKRAQKEKWAIGQFNISTLEQLKGIAKASINAKSPVIIGTSEGESAYLGLEEAVAMIKAFRIHAFLNLDHGKDINLIKKAIDIGYPMVHFDGSGLDIEENIKMTKEVVRYAKRKGVLVEGELGKIRGESIEHKEIAAINQEDLTSPEEVEYFVKKTKVNSLAVAIGNIHGVYMEKKKIDLNRLAEISKNCEAFLVLHGGSDIPDSDVRNAINLGVVKVNINTELRIIWKKSLVSELSKGESKPYKILPGVENAIRVKVEDKIRLFGSVNKL